MATSASYPISDYIDVDDSDGSADDDDIHVRTCNEDGKETSSSHDIGAVTRWGGSGEVLCVDSDSDGDGDCVIVSSDDSPADFRWRSGAPPREDSQEEDCVFVARDGAAALRNRRLYADFHERRTPPRSPRKMARTVSRGICTPPRTHSSAVEKETPSRISEGEKRDRQLLDIHECPTPIRRRKRLEESRNAKQLCVGDDCFLEERRMIVKIPTLNLDMNTVHKPSVQAQHSVRGNILDWGVSTVHKTTRGCQAPKVKCQESRSSETSDIAAAAAAAATTVKRGIKRSKEPLKMGTSENVQAKKRSIKFQTCDICRKRVENVADHIINMHAQVFL